MKTLDFTRNYNLSNLSKRDFVWKVCFDDRAEASYNLIEELAADVNVRKCRTIINCSYTDYRGSLLDRAAIQFVKEYYPKNIITEYNMYGGENAFIFNLNAMQIKDVEDLEIQSDCELNELTQRLVREATDRAYYFMEVYLTDKEKGRGEIESFFEVGLYEYITVYPMKLEYDREMLIDCLIDAGVYRETTN